MGYCKLAEQKLGEVREIKLNWNGLILKSFDFFPAI